ncbi:hypothetical protein BLOT_010730 [Blomia tropicalis]|nr:hypothetical protein BLOT_010730 [Blomia tropicalis]
MPAYKDIVDAFCIELRELLIETEPRSPSFNLKTITINGFYVFNIHIFYLNELELELLKLLLTLFYMVSNNFHLYLH